MTTEAQLVAAAGIETLSDLVKANHILYRIGVLDAWGHVSIRHPTVPDHFLLTRSIAPRLTTLDDIMVYGPDGEPVEQRGRKIYVERFIHSEIYRVRDDVNAVVHSHSPTVVPFGVSRTPLRPICHMSSFLPQRVPVFEIRDVAGMTDLMVSNADLGKALARLLGQDNVALMRGHGDVVVGPDIRYAVYRAYYTEVNARLQLQASALEGPITYLEEGEQAAVFDGMGIVPQRPWELWCHEVADEIAALDRGGH